MFPEFFRLFCLQGAAKHCTQKLSVKNFKTGMELQTSVILLYVSFRELIGSVPYIGNGSGGSSRACCTVTAKLPPSRIADKCGACGNMTCQCIHSNVSSRGSSGGLLIYFLHMPSCFLYML